MPQGPGHPSTLEYRNPFELRRPSALTTIATISLVYAALSLLLSAFCCASDVFRLYEAFAPAAPAALPTTVPTTVSATAPVALPLDYHFNPNVVELSLGADACNFALAILLLAAGVQTLRDRVVAARLHWLFAVIKIPIAILSISASWIIATGMMRNMNAALNAVAGTAVSRSTFSFMELPSLFAAMIACAYAITLVIVLRSMAVRRYYDGLRRGTVEYRNPFELRRPRALTTIAAISLVYAALSLLLSAFCCVNDISGLYEAFAAVPVPTQPATVPATAPVALPLVYHYNLRVFEMALCADSCNCALAILLLIAGVQTIRDRVVAARLHWIFAVVKIPIAILSMSASWMIATGIMRNLNTAGTAIPRSTFGFMYLPSLFATMIACAYVITLLIVLNSATARRYYEELRRGTE